MKKLFLTLSLLTIGGSALAEFRTPVKNNTNAEILASFTASADWAKIVRGAAGIVRQEKYTVIKPGDSYTIWHTGDALVILYPTCIGGRAQLKEIGYDARTQGYGNGGLAVTESGGIVSIEKAN